MPAVDTDRVTIITKSREGSTNIHVEVDWFDAAGAPKGRFSKSWGTVEELMKFLENQNDDDVIRALLLQCINRQTGALRPAVFDGLTGTYEIRQRVASV